MDGECPFRLLGLKPGATRKQVVGAWRRRVHNAREDASLCERLTAAKEQALAWNPGPGERLRRQFEASSGLRIREERFETLFDILTDGGRDAETSGIARGWADRDAFKLDMMRLVYGFAGGCGE